MVVAIEKINSRRKIEQARVLAELRAVFPVGLG